MSDLTTAREDGDRYEMHERNRLRRRMAQATMILVWVIVISFLYGLTSDALAARVEKVWPVFSVVFPSLMAFLGFYFHLGNKENDTILNRGP